MPLANAGHENCFKTCTEILKRYYCRTVYAREMGNQANSKASGLGQVLQTGLVYSKVGLRIILFKMPGNCWIKTPHLHASISKRKTNCFQNDFISART